MRETYQKVMCAATVLVVMITSWHLFHFPSPGVGTLSSVPLPLPHTSTLALDGKAELLERFHHRRQHLRQECTATPQEYSTDNRPQKLLRDRKHRVVFCDIPKNGCSFWKRVFSIIGGPNSNRTVFDLSGTAIHTSRAFRTGPGSSRVLQESSKVLFVRDPYERLFSGYIDKLFCPCPFGVERVVERTILQQFRRPAQTGKCQPGVSFTEFLQYVTNEGSVEVDKHFSRQHKRCFPCHVDYDFIGKLETFHQDADFILKHVLHLDPSQVFGSEQTFEESSDVNIMTDVVLRVWMRCQRNSCVSPFRKMLRLWIVFQVRGFLSVRDPLPVSRQAARDTTQQRFLSLVLEAYRRAGSRAAVRQQRQQALQEAFRSVPRDVLAKVERYVHNDCRLFGYNCSLTSRFPLHSPAPPPVFRLQEALVNDD